MLFPGTKFGPYQVIAPLGEGGMGEVYRAEDTRLEREVALKVLPIELDRDPELLGRFEREALTLASLNHPNIASIYGIEESELGSRCLILELVEGQTLAVRLRENPPAMDEALRLCLQLADALEAAHERGVIHRDLKPANVMVTPRGHLKVLDFGLAKRTAASAENAPTRRLRADIVTEVGMVMGTPGYMSPEQVLAQPQDARTDIFAFGCILFECLTGTAAFHGNNLLEITAAVLHGEPEWAALPDTTPAAVRAILPRLLEKDVERRVASMAEAVRALHGEMPSAPGAPVGGAGPAGSAAAGAATVAVRPARPRAVAAPHNLPGQLRGG